MKLPAAAAAAALELAAHRLSAERLLAELRAGAALRHGSKSAQHEHTHRQSILRPFAAQQMHTLREGARSDTSLQPVTPVSQWLLAPSPL